MAGHTAPLENLAVYSERARTALLWNTTQRALDIALVAISLPLWVPMVFLMAALKVLKGEMSLVGPRPEMPAHAEVFSRRFPQYGRRLAVRPGLTGLAQARGWRGDTSIHERLRSDLEYIGRRGPGMYFAILARTVLMEVRLLVP